MGWGMKSANKAQKWWEKERNKLKDIYMERGIKRCEVMLTGCKMSFMLSFHHKMKRRFYKSNPEKLGEFEHTVLCCVPCHEKLEYNRELNRKTFLALRGGE